MGQVVCDRQMAQHANHGMDVRERSRAKGKSAWADQVLQMFLTSNRKTREEVMLDAPTGCCYPAGVSTPEAASLAAAAGRKGHRQPPDAT